MPRLFFYPMWSTHLSWVLTTPLKFSLVEYSIYKCESCQLSSPDSLDLFCSILHLQSILLVPDNEQIQFLKVISYQDIHLMHSPFLSWKLLCPIWNSQFTLCFQNMMLLPIHLMKTVPILQVQNIISFFYFYVIYCNF